MLIQKYQSSWVDDFNKLKRVFEEKLPNANLRIEHVGSTSVKGLAAKAIIDIDIVYYKLELFEEIKKGLGALGYYHNGNQGIEGREVFKRDKTTEKHSVLDAIQHHLYLCPNNSKELQRHLTFRNHLRNNEKARKEYENLKFEIAKQAKQDKKKYAALKETMARKFIESVISC